jgi:L-fuconolactonase
MNLPFSLVDAHVHFWNPAKLNYPWLAGLPALNRAFLPQDYATAARSANVAKMIFVECGCAPARSVDEVDWISQLAANEPRLKGIVAQVPVERGSRISAELKALAKNRLVKGVRRNLQAETDPYFCLQPDFLAGVRALAQFHFTFDLCITHRQLPAVTQLAARCPEVGFILDHCGKPAIRDHKLDPWRKHLRELASLPNVTCKISGLVTEADPTQCNAGDLQPYVSHVLECFGFDRVLFGGDWPVCQFATPFENWLASLKAIVAGEPEASLRKLFQTNAERIYRV